jgi:hypothetical protein
MIEARIEELRLRERFDLVMAPSHVLSAPAALRAGARHLAAGGRLALELVNPHSLSAAADKGVRILELDRAHAQLEVDYPTGHTHAATVALVWPEEVEDWLGGAGLRLERLFGSGDDLASSPTFYVVASSRSKASE